MRAMICVLAHVARAVKMLSLRCCDWQAHFLGLRVQKNISRLTLITSHSSLANSAHLLRVIGFSHLFLKVSKCPFSPWYTFPGLKTEILKPPRLRSFGRGPCSRPLPAGLAQGPVLQLQKQRAQLCRGAKTRGRGFIPLLAVTPESRGSRGGQSCGSQTSGARVRRMVGNAGRSAPLRPSPSAVGGGGF